MDINWALIAPLIVLQLILLIIAVVDLVKRPKVRWNNKWVWAVIIVFVNIIGPIIYLTLGREED
ncbi:MULTISPECIES: PLD nuclease N-terminal domain-containing protein [Dehalococcoides]|jgi:hypothetical protein|uniref:Cardiolipin synthase N-terminal domain-containing protein n=1 Tax=Dehalococcoides mccartyi (strain VS) TaxID=311424 RepID=D2BJU7_DEHMV|nr:MULTISPECIES: PLD nuclease N-terminal domain-containing protein [Dehalococcoides]ACZ62597.1 hypothetical protein DhcVS_1500 [Dehalococcoides mccartyi VS]AHB14282.1 hypothetical protein GY50_1513 [Dehalococcoides mccartyi GY50]AII58619.1 hypothetical protein X792_08100 [Dehalococcoides mccartyi CG1]APH11734.1 negative regulator of sigma-Y activity [Dehalococcoides mccartyi]QYY58664.1 PLD nuclease N-terminal domain-containing protein [Dehalococcoides mccartyi]